MVPAVLTDVIRQAIADAYPSASLEEVEEHNIFSEKGKISGTIGGEFTLKKNYVYPIATYQESKRDATRAILNALSTADKEDGAAIQIMLRPANEGWAKNSIFAANKIKKDKGDKMVRYGECFIAEGLMEALWKAPEAKESKPEDKATDFTRTRFN